MSENQARVSAEQLLAALDQLKDAIVIYDAQDRFVYCNDAHRELYSKLSPVLTPGTSLPDILRHGLNHGQWNIPPQDHDKFVEERIAQYHLPYNEVVRQLGDGRWILIRDHRMPNGTCIGTRTDITELKRDEIELQRIRAEADRNNRLLLDAATSMRQGLVVFGAEAIEFASARAAEMLDMPPEYLQPGRPWNDYFEFLAARGDYGEGEEGRRRVDAAKRRVGKGERHRLERATTDGRHILIEGEPREGGGIVTTVSDITELKLRERHLQEAERVNEVFRGMIDNLPMSIYAKTADLKLIYVNQAWGELTGLALEGAVGKSDVDMLGADGEKFAADDRRVLSGDKTLSFEETVVNDDGTRQHRVAHKRRFVTADGTQYLIGSTTDVTELKQRELQLEEAHLKAESLFEDLVDTLNSMSLAVVVVDRDLKCEIINDAFYKLWKIDLDSFGPGSPFRALMDINRHNGVYDVKDADWENYVTTRTAEIRKGNVEPRHFERVDGVHMIYSVTNLSSERRLISYFDISEQKQREAQLQEANQRAESADRAKSEFLANMSHEIRTPMNGVMGMAELLAKTELSAKQKTFTDIIIKSGASLLTIINDILDFSKLDAGQMELDPAPFKLAEAIEDVATLVSSRVAEKDLELAVRIDPSLPEMFVGDVGRIRQIITNLMGNAVKFTESGHILVEVGGEVADQNGAATASLLFRVEDTGIGIPQDKVARVFEKFSQVDNSATRKHQGTGLGLAITRSLVELMGGEIGAESELGKGTTFWFRIQMPVHGDQLRRQRIPVDVSGARILVVDDNMVNRAILQEQMAAWRFDSAACEGGREAIEVVRVAQSQGVAIDLVILDYHMPQMDGGEVARIMRADPKMAGIPIIMLTSVDQTEDGRTFSSLGIEAHLMKPARSSLLLETIIAVLEEHAARNSRLAGPAASSSVADAEPKAEPVAANDIAKAAPAAPAHGEVDILVAEDNEVNQIVFTQILSSSGHSFHIVGNGALAVEAYPAMKPRLILMDVSMPVMNGLDATREIRRLSAGSGTHTPIIGVTAHAIKGDMEKCMAAGMDDYVTKPVSPDALLSKIDKWLAKQEGVVIRRSA